MSDVQLVGISSFYGDLKDKSPEDAIVYMARVANPSNQNNFESSNKLIRYLIKNKHWSPFEMVNMCLEINTTRSIAAQILRHRSFSFQEFSHRYSNVEDLGEPIIPALRRQDTKNRQNSIDDINHHDQQVWLKMVDKYFKQGVDLYSNMLEAGIAKECAREILPMASPTRLYMNGTLRSWIHYCKLRGDEGTQLEHRKIAMDVKRLIREHFPRVYIAAGYYMS